MRIDPPANARLTERNPNHVVFKGDRAEHIQISVLEADLIRVQHLPDGTPRMDRTWTIVGSDGDVPEEGRSREDLSPFSLPDFALDKTENGLRISTGVLTATVRTAPSFHISWAIDAGVTFASDLPTLAYAYDRSGRSVFHYMQRRKAEHYYGFGEKTGPLDKAGMRLRTVNIDPMGYDAESSDPLYKHFPFYITYVPDLNIAYGLFYDNLSTSVFDMGKEINAFRGYYHYYQAEDGDLDYYLLYGPTIEQVIEKFTALTGRPMLPPRWSLGYLGSTMSYTEAPNAQEQLRTFAQDCDRFDIPCDMFHLSSGYTTDDSGARNVFTWNFGRVPDPVQMTADFHKAGIKVGANIKPYLLKTHPEYDKVAGLGGFIRDADSDAPFVGQFWSGGLFTAGDGSFIDFTSPAGYQWWQDGIKRSLFSYGIDVTWNDNNEFDIMDSAARFAGFGTPFTISQTRPLQTLLMLRASYEATKEFYPERRPFVLTRAGAPGMQRYAQTWSGDNRTSWHTLRHNIPMGLGLSLSGVPNTGHDIGGFAGPAPEPELLVRWVQHGIFNPRFTIHSANDDGTTTEPWMYPEVLPLIREAIQFRYRLLPYLYSLFYEATLTGHPIIRPLVYDFADDARCRTESCQFLLGTHLLVASVLEPGANLWPVYLPSGTMWRDFNTGQWVDGGQTIEVETPLDRIPLFVRAGGIIPMGKSMRYIGAEPDDMRQAFIYPDPRGGTSELMLYEDDGLSNNYLQSDYAKIVLRVSATPEVVTVETRRAEGNFQPVFHEIDFILPAGDSRTVKCGEQKPRQNSQGRTHITAPLV